MNGENRYRLVVEDVKRVNCSDGEPLIGGNGRNHDQWPGGHFEVGGFRLYHSTYGAGVGENARLEGLGSWWCGSLKYNAASDSQEDATVDRIVKLVLL